ncbi:MAG: YHS domain-containing protein [Candidatus Limnocylindrales bacterium]
MKLTVEATAEGVRAGYACPCGCHPSVEYARASDSVEEGCCCGNQFAVGVRASASLAPRAGFRPETQAFDSPWGERLEAAWLIGPSVHGPESESEASDRSALEGHAEPAIDPVCGMAVDPDAAQASGLHSRYHETRYLFCGKGCKLEFDDDPARYLDPAYVRSM